MRRRPKIYFDFADWWIGLYRGPNHLYVCPLPTLVIRWERKKPEDPQPDPIGWLVETAPEGKVRPHGRYR